MAKENLNKFYSYAVKNLLTHLFWRLVYTYG